MAYYINIFPLKPIWLFLIPTGRFLVLETIGKKLPPISIREINLSVI